jgi:hypothetical protein
VVAYTTKRTPAVIDAARALFGAAAELAGMPNAAPTTWPYDPERWEVVGSAGCRSGPFFSVVCRRRVIPGSPPRYA